MINRERTMTQQKTSVLVATRMTPRERKMVGVAAALEGMSIDRLLRTIVLPAVSERVSRSGVDLGGNDQK